ncbi:hypothetical protein [Lysobacter antibioticus]|uniref:hypothetical protein n=1 Tax=Lysobacter antibioticus TaxID=84531 RepID=UPI0011E0487E|nr:hypothetical protein [Lysobacter antibioticus]
MSLMEAALLPLSFGSGCSCLEGFSVAVAVAVALVVAVRRFALAKANEDPEGGAQGCAPFFIGAWMSRMKNPRVCTARAGLFKEKHFSLVTFLLLLMTKESNPPL